MLSRSCGSIFTTVFMGFDWRSPRFVNAGAGRVLLSELRGHLGGGHNILCQGRKPMLSARAPSRFFSVKKRAKNSL
jgi:hypothetical protein